MIKELPHDIYGEILRHGGVYCCLTMRRVNVFFREFSLQTRIKIEGESSWSMQKLQSAVSQFKMIETLDLFDFFGDLDLRVLLCCPVLRH